MLQGVGFWILACFLRAAVAQSVGPVQDVMKVVMITMLHSGLGFEVRVWGLVVNVRMSRAQDRLPLQEHQGKGGLGF